jgi:hypothetical protein
LTGFQKSTIFKTCWSLINHHFGSSNEEKDFWIIDWFLIVDLVYLTPPIDSVSKSLIIFQKNNSKSKWVVWHVKEMKINEKLNTKNFPILSVWPKPSEMDIFVTSSAN